MYDDQRDRKIHDFHDQLDMTRPYVQLGVCMVGGLDSADAVCSNVDRSVVGKTYYTFILHSFASGHFLG